MFTVQDRDALLKVINKSTAHAVDHLVTMACNSIHLRLGLNPNDPLTDPFQVVEKGSSEEASLLKELELLDSLKDKTRNESL